MKMIGHVSKQKNEINPETDLNETEISDLFNKELKIMVIKMLTEIRRKQCLKQRENFF